MKKLVLDLLLKLITDDVSKRFVIEFLRKQAKKSDNKIDDKAVDMIEDLLFPEDK